MSLRAQDLRWSAALTRPRGLTHRNRRPVHEAASGSSSLTCLSSVARVLLLWPTSFVARVSREPVLWSHGHYTHSKVARIEMNR